MEQTKSSSSRLRRNMKERDRRNKMKDLLSALAFAIHPQLPKMSVPHLLDEATNHAKQMHARIEQLKLRKAQAQFQLNSCMNYQSAAGSTSRILSPILDIKSTSHGFIVEVNLITGLNKNFMLHDVIRILQEEGAEVISLSSHKDGDRITDNIKSQAISTRIGIDTSRIDERLKGLIYSYGQAAASPIISSSKPN